MSIETKIDEIVAAVNGLTAAIAAQTTFLRGQVIGTTVAEAPAKLAAKPAVPHAGNPNVVAKPVAKPAAKVAAPAPVAAPADEAYAEVRAAVLDATGKGKRKQIADMLAEYDVKSAQALDPSDYAEVLNKIAVIVGGGVDDLA